ncbi:hypothetical protein ACI6PS_08710 [Flavobacterium sp. PLA-1-15]|uniref:hypothetical protein n=1 Tax=Flavobacterium sp. PLA-1-15 TaxID=3380533 RepID=UPI003B7626CD
MRSVTEEHPNNTRRRLPKTAPFGGTLSRPFKSRQNSRNARNNIQLNPSSVILAVFLEDTKTRPTFVWNPPVVGWNY